MRNVDTGETSGLQTLDQIEQGSDFGRGQCRCGLIEDQQLGILVERLGDLDELLLAAGIVENGQRRIDVVDIQLGEQFLRPGVHRIIVEKTVIADFGPKEDVFRNRQMRNHHQFLVDDGDARLFRFADGRGLQFVPIP
ncbi:hypothetical protein D3C73_540290 [compost metagenome]